MATLLMVESWLQSTGERLPAVLGQAGHDYVLMTRDPGLYGGDGSGGPPHPALRHADEVVVVETNDADATAAQALAVAARRPLAGVLTTCDYYLPAVATVAARLGLPGASPAVMQRAIRKHEVRAALDAAGLPNPRYAVAATWPEALAAAGRLGYPLVAKPVDLNAGTSVRRVDDDAHLKDAFREITAIERNTRGQPLERVVLLEEILVGVEVSVEAVTVDGRTTVVGITDKSVVGPPAFVESGHMFPAALPPGAAAGVEAFVVDALAAIGLTHGSSHSEVMLTADGPRLVEINPRQGGGYIFDLVHLVTGTHPLRLLIDLALGAVPQVGTAGAPLPSAAVPGGSAAVSFVMSPRSGEVVAVDGTAALADDPRVHRWTLPVPTVAGPPVDNEAYLGHVVTVDAAGPGARAAAESLVGSLRLHLADGSSVMPLGT
jgi:argininosuccinate lyase